MARHSIVMVDPRDLIQIETLVRDILRALVQHEIGDNKRPHGAGFLEGARTHIVFEEEQVTGQQLPRSEKHFRVSVHRGEADICLRNQFVQPEGMSFDNFFLLIRLKIEQALIPTGELSEINVWGPPYTISIVSRK